MKYIFSGNSNSRKLLFYLHLGDKYAILKLIK